MSRTQRQKEGATMGKVGFIGLGTMGSRMGRNALRAGYELVVYDIDAKAVKALEKEGAKPARTPR
jgi:2-hydroxy-3-oxopropionate reductase